MNVGRSRKFMYFYFPVIFVLVADLKSIKFIINSESKKNQSVIDRSRNVKMLSVC